MLKKILIIFASLIVGIYAIFLLLPLISVPFLDKASAFVAEEIQKSTGFKANFEEFRIVVTPKLTLGIKLKRADVTQPDGKNFLDASNLQFKMSLLPVFAGKIRADILSADSLNLNLYIKEDGTFLVEDFFKNREETPQVGETEPFSLPFNLKFSNHLPDLRLKAHNIAFIDNKSGKKYSLTGTDTNITDFIINKKINAESKGKLSLDGFEALNYDIKIYNRIMPDITLDDLITGKYEEEEPAKPDTAENFNIIEAFKLIKKNAIKANLKAALKITGDSNNPELKGRASIEDFSLLIGNKKLPESNANIIFNNNEYEIDSNLYTAQSETTKIKGMIKSGKSPRIDLNIKSNATLKSIFEIANEGALIAGINDLKTLKGQGQINADFNIKSDFKNLNSNGYIKLANGNLNYGLYNVSIDNLSADVKLDNNTVLINKLGFSTMSVPLTVSGKIKPDTTCDIQIKTANLPLKGLLVSIGQAAILKDNPVTTGVVSVIANVKGKLEAPQLTGEVSLNNLDLKNVPSNTRLVLNPVKINLNSTKTGFTGNITGYGIKAINPALTVSIPTIKAGLDENSINIEPAGVMAGKNNFDLSGTISNYMKEKIGLNLSTNGGLKSNLTGTLNPNKMTLDLKYSIPNNSNIVIPGFDKSKITLNGNTSITGSMTNPVLKGEFNVPLVEIPEADVIMKDVIANLNGHILNGNAQIKDFASGGIQAQSIKTDYKLAGDVFHLKNLAGTAFEGFFNGDIAYNLSTEHCKVKIKGEKINALKAIEGAAGIKNALSGNLGFNADIAFKGVEYKDMIKTMIGNADFEIKNGVLANLGNLNSLMLAQNIVNNTLLKSSSKKVSGAAAAKSASMFDFINGKLTFKDGWASLPTIKLSGPSMAYYVTGKYNILDGNTNVVVLGRLSQNIVSGMGNIGDLAVKKLTKVHPAFGALTARILADISESPSKVNVKEIPSLSSADTQYKDFKVVFNGTITSTNSIKSFKWINDPDTSALQNSTIAIPTSVEDVKAKATKAASDLINSKINSALQNKNSNTSAPTTAKEQIKEQAREQARDLLKSFLTTPGANQ